MFTGLIEGTGEVIALERTDAAIGLRVRAAMFGENLRLGESIAINGCCLTVAGSEQDAATFDLLAETLARTNLHTLTTGARVNLERALVMDARLGGHFVTGHIDTVSRIIGLDDVKGDYRLEISLPKDFAQYVAYKGSIAIDGISLTVAEAGAESVVVWIIPHTMQHTNLGTRRAGDVVNLEFDLLAKYVERILARRENASSAEAGEARKVAI